MAVKFTKPLKTAFKAPLLTYSTTNQIYVDWGDIKDYIPAKEKWLRPRLHPDLTKPGPTQSGPHRGTLTGVYAIECMTLIEDGDDAPNDLADDIGDLYFPNWSEPQYLDTSASGFRTHLKTPSILEKPPLPNFNRAVVLIPYLVYATS